ncbi:MULTISPECIES: peptidylprolyl isomerase [Olivibacter]|uniref:Periplasmic chaperone PpiD n=1 Tax=Olivibacter oleidegradans TaxID=760123 RepID=A0ABV6HF43_9SPHI|nr:MULTISPECIES: SurA N-terminal domain-containing protein [Olivibacter]MCL4641710.1 SurA N-terminal domain-containing protein [Olivibacter sp. UJ_SKK_5.1]MDM8177550.1 SurA N-terminal domain-containing protein [Olivibacter sp. 47]MDX3912268.1 SurA N-terminal domain-containing protein [Pseudosphingobacterium sp.]QEK99996.1 peptidylprolyl isomerase [Olivibacter sp. LS-1]
MGLMTFLRNRAGIIIVVIIGLAIVAFLLGDVIRFGTPFWASHQNEVGNIDGESISYTDFNNQVEQSINNMRQQMGGNMSPQMTSYAVEDAWNQNLRRLLLDKELERIGLGVGKNELQDMVTGKNPSPMIAQNFGNPQTGEIDRNQLNQFLANVAKEPANSELSRQWGTFLEAMRDNRLQQKYNNLVQNSVYVTSLEATEDYNQRNKIANFSYVLLDYASIPDKDIKLTDADYQNYYNEHKAAFKNQMETRSFDYVVFNAQPTAQDTALAKETITKLTEELAKSTNDSLFAVSNSEQKRPVSYIKKGTLSPALDSLVFSAAKGSTVGPVYSNGVYESAKILDVRNSPDSVTARHILLNPATEGGVDKAMAKADSIKNLILKGGNFAALAVEFGTDGTKDNGGELGTFARGSMIPAFENAVFDAKPGDVFVLNTQYGVHIIKVDAQKGMSKVVKAAIIDKSVSSSNETLRAAYSKASDFFGKANSQNFAEEAKKAGLTVEHADNITPMQGYLPNLETPREVIKWAFKAEKGDLTDKVYELDNQYVIAKLTNIRPKGQLSLEDVKKEIEPAVLNKVKATKLAQKLNDALQGAKSIDQIAQKVGKTPKAEQNIVFANPILPGVAQENKVVGTVFGLQPKQLSKPIEGNQGVYVVQVTDFVNPPALDKVDQQKQQVRQQLRQRASNQSFQALLDKADIKDNRVRFY